jgi:GAF domain-containing protein
MKLESLQAVSLAIAQERSVETVLQKIVEGLVAQPGVALARLWLKSPGDICAKCPMRLECPDQSECLHLMASAGTPTKNGIEDWSRLNGDFRRFPLGVRKIGKIGATGEPLLLANLSTESGWIARPKWAESEGIQSFAGQPLIFRGEILGVLAVFCRETVEADEFNWLRMFANHASVALANSRAFAEIERLREQLKLENDYLREEVKQERQFGDIIGQSAALKKVLDQISRFQLADGGTLFFDEVGEIPLDLQSKLLRVLQEGTFERVGEEKMRRANVRIVAATNRDLRHEIEAGAFRQDLFFRFAGCAGSRELENLWRERRGATTGGETDNTGVTLAISGHQENARLISIGHCGFA